MVLGGRGLTAVAAIAIAVIAAVSTLAVPVSALVWDFSPSDGPNPQPRFQYAWTDYHSDIILYGGTTGNLRTDSELNDLWRYHTLTNLWESIPVPGLKPDGIGRYGATLSCAPGSELLYLFGGSSTDDAFNQLWEFNMQLLRVRMA